MRALAVELTDAPVFDFKRGGLVIVSAKLPSNGVFSAILRLTDAATHRFAAQFGVYLVCSDVVNSETKEVREEGTVSRNRGARFFYDIRPEISSVEITISQQTMLSLRARNNMQDFELSEIGHGVYRASHLSPGTLQLLITPPDDDDAFPPDALDSQKVTAVLRVLNP